MPRRRTVIYMTVTADKYELPIYVAETVEELAEMYNVTPQAIYSSICRNKSGKNNGYKFVKVKDM